MFPRFSVITLATILASLFSVAQQHQMEPEELIDGMKHPEQISDTTAYRLFLAAYAGKDDQQRVIQQSLFDMVGLVGKDRLIMTATLDDFDVRFKQILDDDAKDVSVNPNTNHTAFHVQRVVHPSRTGHGS
jgi:hypothetical protein